MRLCVRIVACAVVYVVYVSEYYMHYIALHVLEAIRTHVSDTRFYIQPALIKYINRRNCRTSYIHRHVHSLAESRM